MIRNLTTEPYKGLMDQKTKYIPTGLSMIDECLNDLQTGTVTLLTGRPSEGKSVVVHRIIVNAINKRFSTLVIDGEHVQEELINKLYKVVIGADKSLYRIIKCNKKFKKEPLPHILEQLQEWHKNKLYVFSKHETDLDNFNTLFGLIELHCKSTKTDIIIFDNLMSLIDSTSTELNANQSKFMKRCTILAKKMNVAIVLVAHPNKTAAKGDEIDFFQISGNSDLANLADNILQVRKNHEKVNDGSEDGYITILKNRYYGEYRTSDLYFDKGTSSLYEIVNGEVDIKPINWRREGKQKCL